MASSNASRTPVFDKILNFRDVGRFINNNSSNEQRLKTGLFFRSARPDEASQADRNRLTHDLKIQTILDLRSKTELLQQATKHSSKTPPTAAPLAPSAPTAAAPIKIPGLTYTEINLNGSAFSLALMRKLPWSSSARLIWLMALGYRTEAISILGTQVMAPRGLVGLAEDSLRYSTAEVLAIFKVLSEASSYPVLVHCTQGKDRTGLTVLLVLMLLGVSVEAIDRDYVLSQTELLPERKEKLEEIHSIGLPDEFADCPEDWVTKVCEHIDAEYGGIEGYLTRCGVTPQMQDNVRSILLD